MCWGISTQQALWQHMAMACIKAVVVTGVVLAHVGVVAAADCGGVCRHNRCCAGTCGKGGCCSGGVALVCVNTVGVAAVGVVVAHVDAVGVVAAGVVVVC